MYFFWRLLYHYFVAFFMPRCRMASSPRAISLGTASAARLLDAKSADNANSFVARWRAASCRLSPCRYRCRWTDHGGADESL